MLCGRAARPQWLLDPDAAFLNHGSFGACPVPVLRERQRWMDRLERQPLQLLAREHDQHLERVIAELAPVVGADPTDLALVDNATTGVAAVLGSLDLGPGDEVLATDHAYGAVLRALEALADRRGVRVVLVELPLPLAGPDPVVEAVSRALGPRTRLAVLDHITSMSAAVLPVEDLVAACHRAGVPVLVDGAHAPGQLPLDLEALGADWTTGNLHKWMFAPRGCALLHARRDRQEGLHPPVISHGYGQGWRAEFAWTGTRDPTPWLALPAALAFARDLGLEALREHNRSLCAEAAELLCRAWRVRAPVPPSMRAAMCTLPVPVDLPPTDQAALDLNRLLWEEHRVEVPVFRFQERTWLRISAQVYNELDDYARLAVALA